MPRRIDVTCSLCQTTYENVAVERDEDGGYAEIETTPCATCGAKLCANCARFACDGCGKKHCFEHLHHVGEEFGVDWGLNLCPACDEADDVEVPDAA